MKKTCCCCISAILSIIVLLVAVVFGGGMFAYNKFVKPITEITFFEALGLIPGLYKANEDKVVTNPFDPTTDLASFEEKMKTAMFLAPDSKFSINDIMRELLGGAPAETVIEQGDVEAPPPTENKENNKFLKLLQDLNFDFSSLKGYDTLEEDIQKTKGKLDASDKEIAALVNTVFNTVVGPKLAKPGESLGVDIMSIVNVKQVKVSSAEEIDRDSVRLSVVIKVNIQDLIKSVLNSRGQVKTANILSKLMPKKLLLSVEIAPYNTGVAPVIDVNEYSDKNMDLLFKMINGVLNKSKGTSGEPQFQNLMDTFDAKVKQSFTIVDRFVNLQFTGETAQLDAVQSIIAALKLGDISKVDFLTMISYLQCRDLTTFEDIDYDKTRADEFFVDFEKNFGVRDEFDVNKYNFIKELPNIPKNIDINKMNFDKNNEQIKGDTLMDYNGLTELVEIEMKKKKTTGGAGDVVVVADEKQDIFSFIKLRMMNAEDLEKERLKVLIELPFREVVLSMKPNIDASTKHIIEEFIPVKLFVLAEVNLNNTMVLNPATGLMERKYAADPTIRVNDLNLTQTISLFETMIVMLKSLGGEEMANKFTYDYINTTFSNSIIKAFDSIEKNEKGAVEIKFTEKGLLFPTVYELVQSMYKINIDTITPEEMPDEIRIAMKSITKIQQDKFAGDNLKFQSDKELHGGNINAQFAELGTDTKMVPKIKKVNGVETFYFSATTKLNIYDKVMNEQAKKSDIIVNKIEITPVQTMFLETNPSDGVASEILGNVFFNRLITDSTLAGKLLTQTMNADLTTLAEGNKMIPASCFVSYVYAPIVTDGAKNLSIVVNGSEEKSTKIIEAIVTNTQGKPFNFDDLITKSIEEVLKKDIVVNLPPVKIKIGEQESDFIPLPPINVKVFDLIDTSQFINANGDTKGIGYIAYTNPGDIDITSVISDEQKEFIKIWISLHSEGKLAA